MSSLRGIDQGESIVRRLHHKTVFRVNHSNRPSQLQFPHATVVDYFAW